MVAFPLRPWLRERAAVLRCTCIACLMLVFLSPTLTEPENQQYYAFILCALCVWKAVPCRKANALSAAAQLRHY